MTNTSGSDKQSSGDPIPPKCSLIEVHVGELKQLFNSIDPSPFRNKDLDSKAEEFIGSRFRRGAASDTRGPTMNTRAATSQRAAA